MESKKSFDNVPQKMSSFRVDPRFGGAIKTICSISKKHLKRKNEELKKEPSQIIPNLDKSKSEISQDNISDMNVPAK
jgi:hypothetical protein